MDFAFSRDQPERVHVQDRLRESSGELRRWAGDGAVIYVCGGLQGMAPGVDAALEKVPGRAALDELAMQGRDRRDVY